MGLGLSAAITASQLFGLKRAVGQLWLDTLGLGFFSMWPGNLLQVLGMLMLVALGHARLPDPARHPLLRRVGLAALCVTATLFGLLLARLLRLEAVSWAGIGGPWWPSLYQVQFLGMIALALVLGREYARSLNLRQQELLQARDAQGVLRGELDQARQALLRAQIEPHFLFNSLANLRRLLRTEPVAAQQMLGDLLRYLREALPRLREAQATLGSEVELVRAYLAVHQVRMGPRLRVRIDVPVELLDVPLPPMLLLTLAENAIKHGLQPLVEGGEIHIRARAAGDSLELEVADTGRGMGSSLGHGTGLANLRARLRASFGEAASLSLQLNEPRGVIARVRLPRRP